MKSNFVFNLCPECSKLLNDLFAFDTSISKKFSIETANKLAGAIVNITVEHGPQPIMYLNSISSTSTQNKNEFKDWAKRRIYYATKKPQTV